MMRRMQRPMIPAVVIAALLVTTSAAVAQTRDHLQCFKVKDSAAKAEYTADLTTSTATIPALQPGCSIKVPAKLLCIDAAKGNVDPAPPGDAAGAAAQTYLCYKAKCTKLQTSLDASDQFGDHTLEVKSTSLVCAPVGPNCDAASGESNCGGVCVDLFTDPDHCGGCAIACPDGSVCTAGECAPTCDTASGEADCGGVCVNLFTDADNCGNCGVACVPEEDCISGTCTLVCTMCETNCGGSCTDVQTDANNCGMCGTICTFGETCIAGVCTPP
jgi:hypothetical protein